MSHRALVLAAALLLVAPGLVAQAEPAAAPEATPATPARPAIYDGLADGRAQIAAALSRATRENRRVLIQWGADWCSWCHLLHEICASDEAIAKELKYEYDVVLLDIGRRDKHMDLALEHGVDLAQEGVPWLTVLAADGRVLANQETGSLELAGQKAHDPARVLAFLTAHRAEHPQAATLYEEALAQAGRDGRNVLLHFGAPWCPWCHKLDDWLATPRAAELLGRAFVERKIDVDRTLGGQELLARLRGSPQGGIPWFAFVAPDGRVLATSDGPKGNIGFPVTPAEIAWFGDMLRTAGGQLDPAAIDELLAGLAPAADAPAAGSR